jgi:hypothetical protein
VFLKCNYSCIANVIFCVQTLFHIYIVNTLDCKFVYFGLVHRICVTVPSYCSLLPDLQLARYVVFGSAIFLYKTLVMLHYVQLWLHTVCYNMYNINVYVNKFYRAR